MAAAIALREDFDGSALRGVARKTRDPHDELIEDKGVKLLIDPKAVLFLLGTEMDYRTDRMRSGFVFNNPNQTSACGCGESVTLKPAGEAARDTTAEKTS